MIQFNDFTKISNAEKQETLDAIGAVLDSGRYILGDYVASFENSWAASHNCKYGIGVASGLDALEICIRALNLPVGSEVLTTPLSAVATVLAIVRAGLVPVFCDIDPDTGLMLLESAKSRISSQTSAIILVHLYGRVEKLQDWKRLASQMNVALIEDCAQAHGAQENMVYGGSVGDCSAFSFYPTKNLGAIGDAGMILTNNKKISDIAMSLRNYGQSKLYKHERVGLNSRLDELQAAILLVKEKRLVERTKRRRDIANRYYSEINSEFVEMLKVPSKPESHVHHLFVVKCKKRDTLKDYLLEFGINTIVHYPIPIHQQSAYSSYHRDINDLKNAEKFASECLSIPIHPALTDFEVEHIIQSINSFV